jgi:hypothetical protein
VVDPFSNQGLLVGQGRGQKLKPREEDRTPIAKKFFDLMINRCKERKEDEIRRLKIY